MLKKKSFIVGNMKISRRFGHNGKCIVAEIGAFLFCLNEENFMTQIQESRKI